MRIFAQVAALLLGVHSAVAAPLGCVLERPDQDIKRIFPESDNYRARDLIPLRHGQKDLMAQVEHGLGYKLDSEFETTETPFTFYSVFKDNQKIGMILGTNIRTVTKPMQLFIAYEITGKIREIYPQVIHSKDAPAFRAKPYLSQFMTFSLDEVPDPAYIKPPVRMPSQETLRIHQALLRAIRFNALLVKKLYLPFKE